MSEENTVQAGEPIPLETEEAKLDFNHKQIEADMLAAAEARAQDPVTMSSDMYAMYVPHFKRILPKLSTRSLRRILSFLVLYPLEKDSVKATSDLEKEVMHLTNSLIEAKFIMIMSTYAEHAQELYEASQAELTPEQEAEIKTELGLDNNTENKVE